MIADTCRPRWLYAMAAITVFVALLTGSLVDRSPNVGGDAPVLVGGARVAVSCLRAGTFSACGTSADARAREPWPFKSAVTPWPPLQFLIAIPLVWAGMGTPGILTSLSLASITAFLVTGLLLVFVARRLNRGSLSPVLLMTLFASPLLFYGNSTFGEMLATACSVACVASVAARTRPWVIALATCAACITKETAPIFAVGLGLLVICRQSPGGRWLRAATVVYGALLGFLVNSLLNYFRYGTLRNLDLLQPAYRVPTNGLRLNFFAALLVSPNGGILEYWPAATCLLVGVALAAAARRPRSRGKTAAALALVLLFGTLLIGFADYQTPFGWWAWGPRLTLPWMLPFLVAAVAAFPDAAQYVQELAFGTKVRAAVVTGVLLLAALPQISVGFYTAAASSLFKPDRWCRVGQPVGSHQYYICVRHEAWAHTPVLFDALHGIWTRSGLLATAGFCVAMAALAVLSYQAVARPTVGAAADR
jgi:hypothetical protein